MNTQFKLLINMDYLDTNKKLWDERTEIHYQSDFYNVESFLKGKDSLNEIELDLMRDISGKSILHLQCHFGLDTLSLARRGAVVTGVDFSSKAIEKATRLNQQLGLNAHFIESDVYCLPEKLGEKFDLVFASYGVVGWLPDMKKWAETIAYFLKPGGQLVFVEFHPVVWIFSYDFKNVEFNYMDSTPIIEEEGTYTDCDAEVKHKSVSWNHGLANVLDSLVRAGIKLTDIKEYNYSPYNCFQNTVEVEPGKFQISGLENKIPMVYSVKGMKE